METFVVRVWVPVDEADDVGLCGVVQHVRSGQTTRFHDAEELMATLRGATPGIPAPVGEGQTPAR